MIVRASGALALINATGVSTRQLEPLRQALGPLRSARALCRPGWGGEPALPAGERSQYYSAHARWLVERLRGADSPVDLFAWSSAGIVALHAALAAPELIGTLYLYEPPLWSSREHADKKQLLRFAQTLLCGALGSRRLARRYFWQMVTARSEGPCGFERLPPAAQSELVAEEGPLLRELLAGTGEELAGALHALAARVVVLVGAQSGPAARRAAERLAGAVARAEVRVLPGLDHLGPLTCPQTVAAALG